MTRLLVPDVVGVAASTGGPQAISVFLQAFGTPPPAPILIVQHMPRTFTTRFAERLDGLSSLRVVEAVTGRRLRAGEVYIAPGAAHLRVRDGVLLLSHTPPVGGLRPRADLLFADLAREYGCRATVVVLSGMGADGREGCEAIVAAGGQVLVQNARSAVVDGMPGRVRDADLPTLVGTPERLARALVSAWAGTSEVVPAATAPGRSRPPTRLAQRSPLHTRAGVATADVAEVLARLEGVDLASFQPSQVARKVASFQREMIGSSRRPFADALEDDPALRRRLVDRLTVNVTSFFRDPPRWADLDRVMSGTLGRRPRVWDAGCADGSEAYSLAMWLIDSGRHPRVLATDLNPRHLDQARAGRYPLDVLAPIDRGPGSTPVRPDRVGQGDPADPTNHPDPRNRSVRWTVADGDHRRVTNALRAVVRFERHDAVNDPLPRSLFDLVVCRNVIIYLSAVARAQLVLRIADALVPGGILFLGSAEYLGPDGSAAFESLGPTLYRRRPSPSGDQGRVVHRMTGGLAGDAVGITR